MHAIGQSLAANLYVHVSLAPLQMGPGVQGRSLAASSQHGQVSHVQNPGNGHRPLPRPGSVPSCGPGPIPVSVNARACDREPTTTFCLHEEEPEQVWLNFRIQNATEDVEIQSAKIHASNGW